jgi:hypothetical protein
MPLPTPDADESERDFISRCMGNAHLNEKFPDNAQRVNKSEAHITFTKFDNEKQLVYGEVYVPYMPDSQGDFMTPEEIERIAHGFIKKGAVSAIDTEHSQKRNGSYVVESFIARKGDPEFLEGSWVLGVHIPSKETWSLIKRGEINGFSMYGTGRREKRTVELEIPDDGMVFGKTAANTTDPHHVHVFALDFDESGQFTGGETDSVGGHSHQISKGTATDTVEGHNHRFSLLDALMKSENIYSEVQKEWMEKRRKGKKKAC